MKKQVNFSKHVSVIEREVGGGGADGSRYVSFQKTYGIRISCHYVGLVEKRKHIVEYYNFSSMTL